MNAPQTNAWYFLGGSAVHKATEDLDLGVLEDPTAAWDKAWAEELSVLKPKEKLRAGGRASTAFPNKEDKTWWDINGPLQVTNYVKWRDQKFGEGWQWLELDGRLAIEMPFEVALNEGTDREVKVKGYVDRVIVDPNGQALVVDLKAGSRIPDSSLQLGTYRLGMFKQYGVMANLGGYFMTRKSQLSGPSSLIHYSEKVLSDWFSSVKLGIEHEVYVPKVGMFCGSCAGAPYCVAVGGDPAPLALMNIGL